MRQWLKTAASLEGQTLFAAAHYENRRCMHVGPREVFYFSPILHIKKAFSYPSPGNASNRCYMLPEGITCAKYFFFFLKNRSSLINLSALNEKECFFCVYIKFYNFFHIVFCSFLFAHIFLNNNFMRKRTILCDHK